MIIGERSNGKTFDVLSLGIANFWQHDKQMAYIRRWQDDFTGKRGAQIFDAVVSAGKVSEITGGEWTGVMYKASRWYLCRGEGENREVMERPFCYGFAISAQEHDKSTAYPDITHIVFDEFLTRNMYLPDEFVLFMNVLSTIIRDRRDAKIWMLGNTVNKYCPYFAEMGITHIKDMKPGDIDVYRYGESSLTVAVEFTAPNVQGKASDVYFAFDNPKLSMITGKGTIWEIDIYPHCPMHYAPKDIIFTYFIKFDADLLQCEIISNGDAVFTFIHRKTTDIKNPDADLIFQTDYDPRPNYRRRISAPPDNIGKKIFSFFLSDSVYYADNEIGEIVRNYLNWCRSQK